MKKQSYELGTIEASEQLIHDLYIDLRKKANHWASITHQTAQARMGYVGQHLVSVVTGYRLTQKSEPLGVHNASNGSSEDGVCRAASRQCCNGVSRWSVRSKGQRFDFAER